MGIENSQKFCDRCNDYVLATKKSTNHILHLLLSILTCGIWILVWIAVSMKVGGWRCSRCGSPVYKIFTTKEIGNNNSQQNTQIPILNIGGSYSKALPVSIILVGLIQYCSLSIKNVVSCGKFNQEDRICHGQQQEFQAAHVLPTTLALE